MSERETGPDNDASSGRVWSAAEIRALGVATDLKTAAEIFGFSRNAAYEMVHRGQFPVPVIRAGSRYRVPVAAILAVLCLVTDNAPPP